MEKAQVQWLCQRPSTPESGHVSGDGGIHLSADVRRCDVANLASIRHVRSELRWCYLWEISSRRRIYVCLPVHWFVVWVCLSGLTRLSILNPSYNDDPNGQSWRVYMGFPTPLRYMITNAVLQLLLLPFGLLILYPMLLRPGRWAFWTILTNPKKCSNHTKKCYNNPLKPGHGFEDPPVAIKLGVYVG